MGGCFEEGAPAFAGVDTHKGSHTLALLDALGRRLGAREFPADAAGIAALVAAVFDSLLIAQKSRAAFHS